MNGITQSFIDSLTQLFPFLKKEEPIPIESVIKNRKEEAFYRYSISILNRERIPFMVGGTYAFTAHTGIVRPTKDLDIFCKAGDYLKILNILENKGYKTEITDPRWIAKAFYNGFFIDIIFASRSDMANVDDAWFSRAPSAIIFEQPVKIIPAEELIWSKSYVQHREKYDGADVNHLILKKGRDIDWHYLLNRMEAHWEILFSHIINFRFVYPSERSIIPRWFMEEMLSRVKAQLDAPEPQGKITRGHLIAHKQYDIDTQEWGFKNVE